MQRNNRKSCTNCHEKLEEGESIYCMGQYRYAKWRNEFDFCKKCWPAWAERLIAHERDCPENCAIELVPKSCGRPAWMTLPRKEVSCSPVSDDVIIEQSLNTVQGDTSCVPSISGGSPAS